MDITLRADNYQPLHLQIQKAIRRQVEEKSIAPGEFLPPEHRLAEMLKVHRHTVRKAYKALSAEGLIAARRGQGWRVQEGQMEHPSQYFYCTASPRSRHGTHSINVAEAVMAHFAEGPVTANAHFVSAGPYGWRHFTSWLRASLEGRTISGIWTSDLHAPQVAEVCSILSGYDVPIIEMRTAEIITAPYSLRVDYRTMLRQGARYLHSQGCRRIVFLSERLTRAPEREEAFRATCEALDVQGEIVEIIPDLLGSTLSEVERSGSLGAAEVMRRNPRPDGLLLIDDFVGRGALATLLRLRIEVPQEVRVCTLTRAGDSYPDVYGLPVARMDADHMVVAQAACRMMERLAAKETVEPAHAIVPWRLIEPALASSTAGWCGEAAPRRKAEVPV